MSSDPLRLGPDDVHVWRLALEAPGEDVAALSAVLAPAERARAERFRAASHRRRFVVTHGSLRLILARYLDRAPGALEFRVGPQGKPVLAEGGLCFNLSHSHNAALVAVASGRAVGIDVERVRDTTAVERLARRFFAPAERAVLASRPPAARQETFFALWTGKEAYLKATGEGISRDLTEIDVSDIAAGPTAHARVRGTVDGRFSLSRIPLDGPYVGALGVEGSGVQVSDWRWPA